jgi:hypothetical protein
MKRTNEALAEVIPIESRSLELADGAVAKIAGGALELRDREGRLLIRYVDGAAEVAAPSGDLVLSSPSGRVVLKSGLDVEVVAARDVVHRAARRVELAAGEGAPQLKIDPKKTVLETERLRAEIGDAELALGAVVTAARAIATKAESVAVTVEKYELVATRLFERTKDAFRDVSGLAQSRLGRARTVVGSIFTLHAERTVMVSKEETSIDGRKILLG